MTRIAALLLASGLLLANLSIARTKTCEILLAAPTQAGTVVLAPGQYRVTMEGTDAIFLDVRSARSFRTAVRVEDSGATYEVTRISTSKKAGMERMNAIEFEGSGTKIEFR